MPVTATLQLTDQTFNDTLTQADRPVLVDFWAEWCMPCKVVGPLVEELAEAYEGKLIVAKVNIDDAQDTAARLGITAIPTLILFKDGEEVERTIGVQPKAQLEELIERYTA